MTFWKKIVLTILIMVILLEVVLMHEEPRPHVESETRYAPIVYLANARKYMPLEYAEKAGIII